MPTSSEKWVKVYAPCTHSGAWMRACWVINSIIRYVWLELGSVRPVTTKSLHWRRWRWRPQPDSAPAFLNWPTGIVRCHALVGRNDIDVWKVCLVITRDCRLLLEGDSHAWTRSCWFLYLDFFTFAAAYHLACAAQCKVCIVLWSQDVSCASFQKQSANILYAHVPATPLAWPQFLNTTSQSIALIT